MSLTEVDKKVWKFVIALALLVFIPGLIITGLVGLDYGIYPMVGSVSWLVGGFMTWGYGKYQDSKPRRILKQRKMNYAGREASC